ncbi:hypothetical protein CsSME_00041823 [Camellia sinensis var. sinensis]
MRGNREFPSVYLGVWKCNFPKKGRQTGRNSLPCWPESGTMSLEETVYRSPLDNPLHHLTQDDISPLTRFHFPRYLKAKGMRRPSWNKSQAMQQFISLKKLRLILYILRRNRKCSKWPRRTNDNIRLWQSECL